jgi:hypothetical protein
MRLYVAPGHQIVRAQCVIYFVVWKAEKYIRIACISSPLGPHSACINSPLGPYSDVISLFTSLDIEAIRRWAMQTDNAGTCSTIDS